MSFATERGAARLRRGILPARPMGVGGNVGREAFSAVLLGVTTKRWVEVGVVMGLALGAVLLVPSGAVHALALYGPERTLGGIPQLNAVAVDQADDLFVTNFANFPTPGQLVKIPADGGPYTTIDSGLIEPEDVAADPAGNVYVTGYTNVPSPANEVVRVPAGGGTPTVIAQIPGVRGVAADGAGDVFAADPEMGRVVKLPAGGGPETTVVSGLYSPSWVAANAAGDLVLTDGLRVLKIPANGGPHTQIDSVSDPRGVGIDQAGDVFIAGDNRVAEVVAGGGLQFNVACGPFGANAIALDPAGNVMIVDSINDDVIEAPTLVGPLKVSVPAPSLDLGPVNSVLCSLPTPVSA